MPPDRESAAVLASEFKGVSPAALQKRHRNRRWSRPSEFVLDTGCWQQRPCVRGIFCIWKQTQIRT